MAAPAHPVASPAPAGRAPPAPDGVYQRAGAVQRALTERGEHRGAGPVDLLVAATAELSGLTVLHYDADFETVARATGQATAWVAPPGGR